VNSLTPTPFFSGTTAATISVPAGTVVSPGATSATGDNTVARAVAALRGSTTDKTYADLVTRMGSDASDASRRADTATQLAGAADERRQSVNGVSMDEEMTNLVRFQRGYQAASRALSTMDEALDVLINRTGRVGL
jgi:flagellar hook-associated protein 1